MNTRRFVNLLREAHRSGKATGAIFYPVTTTFIAMLLIPFFIAEPDTFDHSDHV